jgi:hypothetical protein
MLQDLVGTTVTLHRADVDSIKGEVTSVDDFGVMIFDENDKDPEWARQTFVAFRDIRGVAADIPNYKMIH